MIRESLPGGGEANASAVRLDQRCSGFGRQSSELLGHCRRREVVRFGDGAHRTQTREFEKKVKSTGFHS
jgi:hypothetical protein